MAEAIPVAQPKIVKVNKKRRPVRAFLKSAVNVPRWIAWGAIANSSKTVVGLAKGLFVAKATTRHETFEQAVSRLGLRGEQFEVRQKGFLRMAWVYVAVGCAVLAYAAYMALNGHAMAMLLSVALAGLCFSFAYREHFWYMQMTERRLGCTFQDWLAFITRGLRK